MPNILFVGRIGWLVTNIKAKRKKLWKKNWKDLRMKILKNEKKSFFPIVLKNIFRIRWPVACTDIHKYKQTYIHQSDYRGKPFQGFRSSLPSAHHQGAVKYFFCGMWSYRAKPGCIYGFEIYLGSRVKKKILFQPFFHFFKENRNAIEMCKNYYYFGNFESHK